MTPNLWVRPLHPGGPTADNRANCLIIGERQHSAGEEALHNARSMQRSGVDAMVRYVDFSSVFINGRWTPEGTPARTGPACMGAGAFATSREDNWNSQVAIFDEGQKTPIPKWLHDVQAPKVIVAPLGLLPPWPWIPEILPLQIMRIGDLILAGAPAEFTIVAGLRVRRVVAAALNVSIDNVILQGYSNGYSQYVTTPEEYDSQQYEGGETQFGRWTLSAYMQEFDRLARAFAANKPLSHGPQPRNKSAAQPDLLPPVPADTPVTGHKFGDVIDVPRTRYSAGDTVKVGFVGAHPTVDFRTDDTYFTVQRQTGATWTTVFTDNDWCTEMHWARPEGSSTASIVTVHWTVPPTTTGTYRIRYTGDRRAANGTKHAIAGESPSFTVG